MLNVFGQKLESLNKSHCRNPISSLPKVKFKFFMFLAVSNVTKHVPTSADIGAYMVTFLTAKNTNMFKFSDAQYAKIVYNYNNTKEKLYKIKAPIWYYIKRAKPINLCRCWNINGDHQNVLTYFGGEVKVL